MEIARLLRFSWLKLQPYSHGDSTKYNAVGVLGLIQEYINFISSKQIDRAENCARPI